MKRNWTVGSYKSLFSDMLSGLDNILGVTYWDVSCVVAGYYGIEEGGKGLVTAGDFSISIIVTTHNLSQR